MKFVLLLFSALWLSGCCCMDIPSYFLSEDDSDSVFSSFDNAKQTYKDAKNATKQAVAVQKGVRNAGKELERLAKLEPISKEVWKEHFPKKVGAVNRTSIKWVNLGNAAKQFAKEGEDVKMGINVQVEYKTADKKKEIDIQAWDGAGGLGGGMAWMMHFESVIEEEADTHITTNTKMDGVKVHYKHTYKNDRVDMSFNHHNRYYFKVNSKGYKPKELWNLIKKMDLDGLPKG